MQKFGIVHWDTRHIIRAAFLPGFLFGAMTIIMRRGWERPAAGRARALESDTIARHVFAYIMPGNIASIIFKDIFANIFISLMYTFDFVSHIHLYHCIRASN